jgi:hypothetical protein
MGCLLSAISWRPRAMLADPPVQSLAGLLSGGACGLRVRRDVCAVINRLNPLSY